jgi:hypothetical protein
MFLSRAFHKCCGCPVAKAEARTAMPLLASRTEGLLEGLAQSIRPGALARYVVANVKRDRGPLLEREAPKEAHDAISLGRRDGQSTARVLQRAAADPADPILDGVEHRQQQRPPRTDGVPAKGYVVVRRLASASLPQRGWFAEDAVDRRHLFSARRAPRGADVH